MNVRALYDAGFIVIEDSLGRELYYVHVDELKKRRCLLEFLAKIGGCRWISVEIYRAIFAILLTLEKEAKQ